MENQPHTPPDSSAANLAAEAHAGTPHYGSFGLPETEKPAADAAELLSATPRVYVGGYVDPTGEHGGCPTILTDASEQRGHVQQNQATAAVRAAQGADEDVERAAYALDDPRYAGGNPYNLADEQTGF